MALVHHSLGREERLGVTERSGLHFHFAKLIEVLSVLDKSRAILHSRYDANFVSDIVLFSLLMSEVLRRKTPTASKNM